MVLKHIKRLCEKHNITIAALERETKIGNGVIARWGEGNPRVDLLKRVADYFGVTVDDLLKEESTDAP